MFIDKTIDRLFKIVNLVSRILLMIIFIVMWIVIFGRYLLKITPVWGEELVLFSLLWLGLLSGAEALRSDLHIKITMIDRLVSKKFLAVQDVIYDLLIIVVSSLVLYHGVLATVQVMDVRYMGLKFSESFAYAAIPVGFALFLIAKFEKYYKKFTRHQAVQLQEEQP